MFSFLLGTYPGVRLLSHTVNEYLTLCETTIFQDSYTCLCFYFFSSSLFHRVFTKTSLHDGSGEKLWLDSISVLV